jgi:hypothetical protein
VISSFAFSDCPNLSQIVFNKKPKHIEDNGFNRCSKDMILYGGDDMKPYAKENNYQLEGISKLPEYIDKGVLKPEDEEENLFSGGHTALIIIILLIDCGIVAFFTVYLLFYSKKKRKVSKISSVSQK